MDKRTQYFKLKNLVNEIKEDILTLDQLKALVSINIASTPSTVENAVRLMGMTGLIKDIGAFRFKINHGK